MPTNGYTAYQLYGNLQYQEAEQASVNAYTRNQLKCPHSQRGFSGSFDYYNQRSHFDAANTTCCNEQVRPFENKPQYSETTSPATARDCEKINCEEQCKRLSVGGQRFSGSCADKTLTFVAKVMCPNLIPDLKGKKKGSIDGDYGTWKINGLIGKNMMQLAYTPKSELQEYLYDNCGGSATYTEYLGRTKFSFTFRSGLDSPGGCYCDCCGDNGDFPPPTHLWTVSAMSATWENTLTLAGIVKLDSACKDGSISGSYYLINGGGTLPWVSSPIYYSNGSTRYIQGTPGTIGGSSNPACCGASVNYSGSDGCGWNGVTGFYVPRKPAYPNYTPAAGTLYAGSDITLQVTGACNKSGLASLTASGSGLITGSWSATDYSQDGIIKKMLHTLSFSESFQYKGCCGNGQISSNWNDGCNYTGNRAWQVRNPASTPSTLRGVRYRINYHDSYYYVQRSGMRCDGASDGSWVDVTSAADADTAKSFIDEVGDATIQTDKANPSLCPGNCGRYTNNNLSGISFEAALFCLDNTGWQTIPICCTQPFTLNGAWAKQASSTCCPNT